MGRTSAIGSDGVVRAAWLTAPATRAVFAALDRPGVETRAVGGAVRNALFGRPVKDVDLATTALPDAVLRYAADAGLKAVETGRDHGTITVIARGRPFEVTTLRRDVETDGRHAKVEFTDDWSADARRRDFTVNALYCDAAGAILDPLGGLPDVAARRIRFIGSARNRIREDYLRSLRFFRLWAEYGLGPIDAEGVSAVSSELGGIAQLSGERIRGELLRLLAAERALEGLEAMERSGLGHAIFARPADTAAVSRLIGIEDASRRDADPVLRLAAAWVRNEHDAQSVVERLRLSNDERVTLIQSVAADAALAADAPESRAKLFIYRSGRRAYEVGLLATAVRSGTSAGQQDLAAKLAILDGWDIAELPVSGADVIAAGVPAGPRVGRILDNLEEAWAAAGFPDDRAWALARLSTLANAVK